MKLFLIVFGLIALIVTSCNKNNTEPELVPVKPCCGVQKPLEELKWLREIKFEMEANANMIGGQIIAYRYNGEDVFWIDDCYNCADKLVKVFDCSGGVICEFGGIAGQNTCPDFAEKATDSLMLFNNVAPEYVFPTKK